MSAPPPAPTQAPAAPYGPGYGTSGPGAPSAPGWGPMAQNMPGQSMPPGMPGMPGMPGGLRPQNPHDTPSLIAGLLSFVFGPLAGVPALIFGIKGRRYTSQSGVGGGASMFGIVMGVLSIIGTLLVLVLILAGFSSGTFGELNREIDFELLVEDQIGASISDLADATVTCDEVPVDLEPGDTVFCRAEPAFDSALFSEGDNVPIEVLVGEGDEVFVRVL